MIPDTNKKICISREYRKYKTAKANRTNHERRLKKKGELIMRDSSPDPESNEELLLISRTMILSKASAHHVPRALVYLSTQGYYIGEKLRINLKLAVEI
jgi:hypothetical protein